MTFTQFHVVLSLIGIAAGLVAVVGMWQSRRLPGWTALFLATTVATSVTGFLFPFTKVGPPHVIGVISLVALAFTLLAFYVHRLAGAWRWIYVTTAVTALYLNVFVGVVQAFLKIPALHALAPEGSGPVFGATQGFVFLLFVGAGVVAARRCRPAAT